MYSFLLDLYPEVKLLVNKISTCLALVNNAKNFSKVMVASHTFPLAMNESFNCSTLPPVSGQSV